LTKRRLGLDDFVLLAYTIAPHSAAFAVSEFRLRIRLRIRMRIRIRMIIIHDHTQFRSH